MSAFGTNFSKDTLDDKFGASGTLYLALNADDPGPDGQGVAGYNEFTGSGYARAPIANGDWAAATVGMTYVIKSNANDITFPTATGTWASGNDATWMSVWRSLSGTYEADFVVRVQINTPGPVVSGKTPYVPAGQLQIALSV